MDRTTAIAIFDDRVQAQRAIEQLKRAGFTEKEIGVTARDMESRDSASLTAAKRRTPKRARSRASRRVPASARSGASVSWPACCPGSVPPLPAALLQRFCRALRPAPRRPGVAGTLIGLGIPEEEANYYDQEFQAGRVVVTVDAGARFQEAQSILVQNSGYDMPSAPERAQRARPSPYDERGSARRRGVGERKPRGRQTRAATLVRSRAKFRFGLRRGSTRLPRHRKCGHTERAASRMSTPWFRSASARYVPLPGMRDRRLAIHSRASSAAMKLSRTSFAFF